MTKCIGCGYSLQKKYPDKLGYIPEDNDGKYCQRCYKIIHYNDAKIVDNPKEVEAILQEVNTKSKFAFFLVDFLNVNNETMGVYDKIEIPKCLVISKADIIPSSVREIRVKEWLKDEYAVKTEIILVSALRNMNIGSIARVMEDNEVKEAYLLAFTNAGKSSLINKIYEKNCNKKSTIATSVIPNTTMDFIKLKISDKMTLIDSPGFVLNKNIYENDEVNLIKKVNAKTFLKPITYQMKKDESVTLEDKFRFINLDDKNSFTFYVSGKIDLDKLFISNDNLMDLEAREYAILENSDVVIKGVGFINIKKECKVLIYSNLHELIEIRRSVFRN